MDLDEINAYKNKLGLANLHFIKGFFQDIAKTTLEKYDNVVLAHIDCDIYESVRYAYESVRPHMMKNGYYVFDDATASSCIGATSAVEKFVIRRDGLNSEQIYPHFVFRHSL